MTNPVVSPLTVEVDNRTWQLYTFEYETADGKFSGYLYAISAEHAVARLEELKQTAVMLGPMVNGNA